MPYIDGLAPGWVEDVAQVNLELELDANMARLLTTPTVPNRLILSTGRLLWAAMDAGRHLSLEPDMHSDRKRLFNTWRIVSALGFLTYDGDNYLRRDSVLPELETTEKTQVGHAIGALCAAALSWELLGARAVVHVSTMDKHYPGWIHYGPDAGQRRPDYIAVDLNHDCFVLEAKGREDLRKTTRDELRDKVQAGVVAGVCPLLAGLPNPLRTRGFVPKAQVGVATDYGGRRLKVFATDPPPDIAIFASPAEIIQVYYRELFAKCSNEDADAPAPVGLEGGVPFQLEVPYGLERYREGVPDNEVGRPPTWRRIETESEEGISDRFVLWQQFQNAATEAGMTGPEWEGVRNLPIDPIQLVSPEAQTGRLLELAGRLWGENGRTILTEILAYEQLQPDGTTVRLLR